jgi:sugar phosphate isomerase/epimerase
MLIGAMNHPAQPVLAEMAWMAEMGFDFIDLTLEPPAAASWRVDAAQIRQGLDRYGLQAVGHTAYYLPLASPFDAVRQAAVAELLRCLEVFAAAGVRWMNVHPDRVAPLHGRSFLVERNRDSLAEVVTRGREVGVGVMIENVPGEWNNAEQLDDLFRPLPDLGLHLDIGHANLQAPPGTAEAILAAHGGRLRHVHAHDNRGGTADLHLPLGAGNVDTLGALRALRRLGYDGTITLEVFSPDRRLLDLSRTLLKEMWAAAAT